MYATHVTFISLPLMMLRSVVDVSKVVFFKKLIGCERLLVHNEPFVIRLSD